MEDTINRLLEIIEKKDQLIERLVYRLVGTPMEGFVRSTPQYEVTPAYMSESEQDLHTAYESRLITKSELEDKLAELRFMNTEINFHE